MGVERGRGTHGRTRGGTGAHGRTCWVGGQDVCERIPCTQAQGAHPRGGPEDRGCGPGRVGVTGRAGSPPPPGVVLQSRGAWACAHGCAAAPVVLLRGRVGRAGVSLGDADPGLQERGHLRSTDQPLGWHRVPQCGDVRPDARERRAWPAARPASCPGPLAPMASGGRPPAVSLGPCVRVTMGHGEAGGHLGASFPGPRPTVKPECGPRGGWAGHVRGPCHPWRHPGPLLKQPGAPQAGLFPSDMALQSGWRLAHLS